MDGSRGLVRLFRCVSLDKEVNKIDYTQRKISKHKVLPTKSRLHVNPCDFNSCDPQKVSERDDDEYVGGYFPGPAADQKVQKAGQEVGNSEYTQQEILIWGCVGGVKSGNVERRPAQQESVHEAADCIQNAEKE